MAVICQDSVGRCSFIDVLEEAVLVHRPVAVALRDGERFIDVVTDVVTENHEDYAVFRTHERVAVTDGIVVRVLRRADFRAHCPEVAARARATHRTRRS